MGISSYAQLDSEVNSRLEIALTNTMEEVMDRLHEFIQNEVYSYNQDWYERSMELLNNWEYTKPQLIGKNTMLSTLAFSQPISHSGEPNWQHGMSYLSNQALLEIVNEGRIGNICGFPQIGARPFLDEFMKWVNLNIYTIFKEHAKNTGLPISNITVR